MAKSLSLQEFEAPPARCNDKVYLVPSKDNKFVEELISKMTPDGKTNIRDLNGVDVSSNPNLCVLGLIGWVIGAKGKSLKPLNKNPLVFMLKDFQNTDCEIKVTVTGKPTNNFPNPLNSTVYVLNPKCVTNEDFKSPSSEDGNPFSFLIDNNTNGCIVVVSKPLYKRHIVDKPSEVIGSLLPIIEGQIMIPKQATCKEDQPIMVSLDEETLLDSTKRNKVQSSSKSSTKRSTKSQSVTKVSKKAPVYVYTKLQCLKPKTTVNIAGVVNSFGKLSVSKGKDNYLSFTIVDNTVSHRPVTVIAFNADKNKIPAINEIGDIVLLRHTKVNLFNDSVQVVAPHFSSHHVFDSDSLSPIDSSDKATLSQNDVQIAKLLQKWAIEFRVSKQQQIKKLNEIKVSDVFDIIGLVCNMTVVVPNKFALVAITDGTMPKFNTGCFETHFPNCAYSKKYDSLLVTIHITNLKVIKSLVAVSPGTFVCIENVYARLQTRKDTEGNILEYIDFSVSDEDPSSLAVLPESDKSVMEVKKVLDMHINPVPSGELSFFQYATFFMFSEMPFTTIKHITDLKYTEACEFRVDVSAILVDEKCVEDVVKLCCLRCLTSFPLPKTQLELNSGMFCKEGDICRHCREETSSKSKSRLTTSKLVYSYYFMLIVTDGTSKLEICVCKKDASVLFLDIPPVNLYLDKKSRDKILHLFVNMFGYNPFEPKPDNALTTRLDCGIYLYDMYESQKIAGKTLVLHKIFGTVIVPK